MQPRILSRSQHILSRKQIDPDALRVLYRLRSSGFKGFLVGGGVRDLLLGRKPKDFDIATDASPQQVKKLFRNCFIIGRRFRLCHVRFGQKVVEVAPATNLPEELRQSILADAIKFARVGADLSVNVTLLERAVAFVRGGFVEEAAK